MKTELNLPANCAVMTEDEMMYTDGGVKIGDFEVKMPAILAGAAAIAVGAACINMFNWFTGKSDSNFIEGSINAGSNFINGSVNAGQNFLNGLLGK